MQAIDHRRAMNSQPAGYTLHGEEQGAASLALTGDWVQGQQVASFRTVQSELAGSHPNKLIIDGSALGAWDSLLMAFLLQCHDYCKLQDLAFETRNMPGGTE